MQRIIIVNGYTGNKHDGFKEHTFLVAIALAINKISTVLIDDGEAENISQIVKTSEISKHITICKRDQLPSNISNKFLTLSLVANNELHHETYRMAILHPDIVIFHDASMFWIDQQFDILPENSKINKVIENWTYVDAIVRTAKRGVYNELAKKATVVATYSKVTAQILKYYKNAKHIESLPLIDISYYLRNFEANDGQNFSASNNSNSIEIDATNTTFGVIGYIHPAKNIIAIIRAFELYIRCGGDGNLIIVGKCDEIYHHYIMKEIKSLPNVNTKVRVLNSYQNQKEYEECLGSVDVIINIRFGHSGEASGVMSNLKLKDKIVIGSEIGGHEKTKNFIGIDLPTQLIEQICAAMMNAEVLKNARCQVKIEEGQNQWDNFVKQHCNLVTVHEKSIYIE